VANGRDVSRTINRAKTLVNGASAVRLVTSYNSQHSRQTEALCTFRRMYTRVVREGLCALILFRDFG